MGRECKRCLRTSVEFQKVVDRDLGVLYDTICKACRSAEPKAVRKPARKPQLKAETIPTARPAFPRVSVKEARQALKAYALEDVRDPVALITGPCHYTGAGPAMCLDLLDRRGRAEDGNVVPCAYYVKAAKGNLTPSEFVSLCVSIANGAEQRVAQVRESLAMSARYDAAGGRIFEELCRAVAGGPHGL